MEALIWIGVVVILLYLGYKFVWPRVRDVAMGTASGNGTNDPKDKRKR